MVMSTLLEFGFGVAASITAAEALAFAPHVAAKCIRVAVGRLPRRYRDRFNEEWSADMLAQPSNLSKLIFSLGLLFAAQRIYYTERNRIMTARAEVRKRSARQALALANYLVLVDAQRYLREVNAEWVRINARLNKFLGTDDET